MDRVQGEACRDARNSLGDVIGITPAAERLRQRLRTKSAPEPSLDEKPCCVYGLVTRTCLENLVREVEDLKRSVNTLLWGAGTAVLLDVVMRLAGM